MSLPDTSKTRLWSHSAIALLIAGTLGTLLMSIPMYHGALLFFPYWPVPHMLAAMFDIPISVGWLLHLGIGYAFAAAYMLVRYRRPDVWRQPLFTPGFAVIIYFIALLFWIIVILAGLVRIGDYFPLTYPYLLEHIIFIYSVRFVLHFFPTPPARLSNYDLL